MPFQPGQSGNPNGNSKGKRFYAALDRAIAQDDGQKLRNAADKLLELAEKGEPWAVQMLADRLDGKAAQSLSISGEVGIRKASEMTDEELAAIANASRATAP